MLMNAYKGKVFLWLLLFIGGLTAVTRADNYRKSNVVGYRPAAVNNQTHWQRNNQTHYNRTQINQPGFRAGTTNPQLPKYGQVATNQIRPSWQQPQASIHVSYPSNGQQGNFNRTQNAYQQAQAPNYAPYAAAPQLPKYGQVATNQIRPSWQQPQTSTHASYPSNVQRGNFNRTQLAYQQAQAPNYAPYAAAPQLPKYGQVATNQIRPSWQQPQTSTHASYSSNVQLGNFNRTQLAYQQAQAPNYAPYAAAPQLPKYGQVATNQIRPSWQQPQTSTHASYPSNVQHGNFNRTQLSWQQSQPNYAPYPANGQQVSLNQTKPVFVNYPQPSVSQGHPLAPFYPHNPVIGQNQTRSGWLQPSAPQLPNYPAQRSWPSSTPQLPLYPKLTNTNLPLAPAVNGGSPQAPQNWHYGGQAALSYGPVQKPLPANSTHKTVPIHNGSRNPYANIFN